jgi:hypothetical protein
VLISNKSTLPIGVRTNGAEADEFEIEAGKAMLVLGQTAVGLTAIVVTTTAIQTEAGVVEYNVFGD